MDNTNVNIHIPQLFGNKIKPTDERFGLWLLLENLSGDNLITDVGNIDYTVGEDKLEGNGLSFPITEPFCDNIMVVKICNQSDCETQSAGERQLVLKKEVLGSFNCYLRGKFSNFVSARHGVKAKLPFLLSSENRIAKGLSTIIKKEDMEVILGKYETPVAVPYKIELADVQLDTLLDKIAVILRDLEKEHYYLVDLDITQDFAGIFSKPEMIKFLIETHDFCYQGESRKNNNIIQDDYKIVGNDCLTWLTSNTRVKIYNKFVCQMTSPGVSKTIGNHVLDFLHCPDKRLKETFNSTLAREHGITRLEATIYNYTLNGKNGDELDPVEDCKFVLEKSKSCFLEAPFYSVPIAKMWTKLSEALKNSCCVVINNLLQHVYWGNGNTRKLTGLQFRLPEEKAKREKLIEYALSAYSFNLLPINYVEIKHAEGSQNGINMSLKCFIKQGATYFTKTSRPYSAIPEEVSISNAGLIDTANVIPRVRRNGAIAGSKLNPFLLKEIQPLGKPFVTSGRKRQLELEETEMKKRKLNYTQTTIAIREQYRDQLAKEEQIRIIENRLKSYFNTKWEELGTTGSYELYAFAVNKTDKFLFVGVLVKKGERKSVHYSKGYPLKIKLLQLSNNSGLLHRMGFVTLNYSPREGTDGKIFYLPSEEPIGSFNMNGLTSFKGYTFPKVENFRCCNVRKNTTNFFYNQCEVDKVNYATMRPIRGSVKLSACQRMENLEEGLELIVCGVKEKVLRNKNRYILQFEGIDGLYLSNYWLEKEIEDLEADLKYKLKIKLDKIKTTPTKKKERVVFCVC